MRHIRKRDAASHAIVIGTMISGSGVLQAAAHFSTAAVYSKLYRQPWAEKLRANMLSKSKRFRVGALAAGIWILFGPSFAAAESAASEVTAPTQQGATKVLTQGEIDAVIKRLRDLW